ncbi:MAG: FecR domain-containing protein [Paludibacter sp.]|nr:FecR domain-containing protein [Paludibacter sp.]
MQEIEKIVIKSFSGEISQEEKDLLMQWLNESADNEKYYAQLKNIWQISGVSFRPEEIDLEKAENIVSGKIIEKASSSRRRSASLLVWWQRVAAIIVLPLLLSLGYLLLSRGSAKDTEIVYQEVMSPPGTCSKVKLTDGTTVWLNSKSVLKYPTVFRKDKREVFLAGEAYFEVKSDKQHPFIVKTRVMDIKATGTTFNVEAFDSDNITAVTLIEGKVKVDIKGKQGVDIIPNQRISYDNKIDSYNIDTVNPYKWYAWKDGVLMFRDDPLEYVFKRIGLTYNINIEVMDKGLAKHPYRATFEGESIDEILRLIKMTAPIEYITEERIMTQDDSYSKRKIEVYKVKK